MMQLSEQQCYYVAPTTSHSAAPLRRGRNSQLSFRDIVKVYDVLILTSGQSIRTRISMTLHSSSMSLSHNRDDHILTSSIIRDLSSTRLGVILTDSSTVLSQKASELGKYVASYLLINYDYCCYSESFILYVYYPIYNIYTKSTQSYSQLRATLINSELLSTQLS